MKKMMRFAKISCIGAASLLAVNAMQIPSEAEAGWRDWRPAPSRHFNSGAKYVFFFIGDGMSHSQIQAAEAYLAQASEDDNAPGSEKNIKLTMNEFPVHGMSTTYANNRYITGSAAAGTALATGMKTDINVIAMAPDLETEYKTLAEVAKERGMKVGIVSSVSIDHATPATFYSHQPTRSMYHEIGHDLVNSNFDYFGGGGFKKPDGPLGNIYDAAYNNDYQIITEKDEFLDLNPYYDQKIIAYNHTLAGGASLYYEVDRPADHISLAEFTRKGIELLDNRNGFFMMVEGGKIDWACHANDAKTAIEDTLAFDAAIEEAVKFYHQHPRQTLIVVTGDHETGGMGLGFAGTRYATSYEILDDQLKSYEGFNTTFFNEYKATSSWSNVEDDITEDLKAEFATAFGITYEDLTDYEKKMLEDAFDRSMNGTSLLDSQEDQLLYGGYEALTVTMTHLINRKAGISWTSYSHTGVPVPVMAKGRFAKKFNGFYDNTDVAHKIAQAMAIRLNN